MAVLFIFFFLFSFHLSFTVSTVVAQNHKIKILVILNIRPENHIVLRRSIILEPTTTHPADLSVSSGLTSSMDDQDGSRSFDETGGYDQVNEYYDPTPAIDQDVRFANRESCANYENEYPDQFADPNHQSYVGFDLGYLSNNTFSPGAYSPELDLHTDFPNFTSSTPGHQGQYVYPVSDPELALQQVEDGLGYQPTSPWDPVAHDPTYLAPNYHPPPSTTYRTLASRATRSQADVLSRSSTHTPSNWDAVSSRSGLSASSGATTCGTCGKSFGDARLARRHQTEVHRRDSDPEYVCKCNNYRVTRKSNYIRHLRGSCKGKDLTDAVYVCKCTEPCAELGAHLAHVQVCGKKRAGRPPNSSRSSYSVPGGDQVSIWRSSGLF